MTVCAAWTDDGKTWTPGDMTWAGGKPSKGTPADKRLKDNKDGK